MAIEENKCVRQQSYIYPLEKYYILMSINLQYNLFTYSHALKLALIGLAISLHLFTNNNSIDLHLQWVAYLLENVY